MIAFSTVSSFGAAAKPAVVGNEDNPAVAGIGTIEYFENVLESNEPFLNPYEVRMAAQALDDAKRCEGRWNTLRRIRNRGLSVNLGVPEGCSRGLPVTDPEEKARLSEEMKRVDGERTIALEAVAAVLGC